MGSPSRERKMPSPGCGLLVNNGNRRLAVRVGAQTIAIRLEPCGPGPSEGQSCRSAVNCHISTSDHRHECPQQNTEVHDEGAVFRIEGVERNLLREDASDVMVDRRTLVKDLAFSRKCK